MVDSDEDQSIRAAAPFDDTPRPGRRRRHWFSRALVTLAVLVVVALVVLWTQREQVADDIIAGELKKLGIPATYEVTRIGGRRQVLRNVVVGDPRRPDLTVQQAEVRVRYRWGAWPTIGRVTLIRPRLYGSYRRGTLSFGTLDPLIFREPERKEFEFPDLDLRLVDGRALLASDYGRIGFKAEGAGNLRENFRGVLAVAARDLAGYGCRASGATFYGALAIRSQEPRLVGPLRVGQLRCPGRALALAKSVARLDLALDRDFAAGEGTADLVTGPLAMGENQAEGLRADARLVYRNKGLTMRLDGAAGQVRSPAVAMASLATEGTLRAGQGFARLEYQGSIDARGVQPGPGLDASLAGFARTANGTLLEPLLAQARRALLREGRGSRLAAELDFRRTGEAYSLIVPEARWRGGSGAALLDLSRMAVNGRTGAAPRLAGNFLTGGPGLPRIAGRMEHSTQGRSVLRLSMAEYRAGQASLALPSLLVAQARDGSLGFVGAARATGALPGGFARNLVLPVDGGLSARGQLALFRRCTTLRFESLTLSTLTLERRNLTLCPRRAAPILRASRDGVRLAFGASSLNLAGRLGQTPVRIASGPVGFAYPGVVTMRGVQVALGSPESANLFRLGEVQARIGNDIAGTVSQAEVRLFATPLDVTEASGRFRYAAGRLTLSEATMRVSDRAAPPRFEPLMARDASLTFAGNLIDMEAVLRHPPSDRAVARAEIQHELAGGHGHADLFVEGLTFDETLQPAALSRLALGTVANARGAVSGVGRIDWSPGGVTSTGSFSTESLDFAAAFGPVRGLSGTVRFTDLLGLVTAPDQEVRVASVNPGIEVTQGLVRFELLPGKVLRLKSASWPFLGGKLALAPTDLRLGVSEARRYVLLIEGLDAARFVERMELGNISATGTFDGKLPLIFSAAGGAEQVGATLGAIMGIGTPEGAQAAASSPGSGRIEGGLLESRPPGGNVSYVGELTYRDLSAMANFAFQTLRSLDYQRMTITLDGALEGEIVSRVRFDGVQQGAGAKRNILTRAIANLPIQFLVNIRAPFYQLINSMKALYDPVFVKDPRMVGLLDEQGRPITPPAPAPPRGIQPSESETVP